MDLLNPPRRSAPKPLRPSACSLMALSLVALIFSSEGIARPIEVIDDLQAQLPEEYEVEEGDSLWLISQEFLHDPWLWPNLWAMNPQISNPHWIYPGDLLRLRWTDHVRTGQLGLGLEPVRYNTQLQETARVALNEGLIDDGSLRPVGVIVGSPESRSFLASGDRVYLKLIEGTERPNLGQRYSVFGGRETVYHPKSGDLFGQKMRLIGQVEVEGLERDYIRGRIIQSLRELERGDLLFPPSDTQVEINPTQNLVDTEGVIVDSLSEMGELGQGQLVFVDRGEEDGVVSGNRFFVLRRGDGVGVLEGESEARLPEEQVGELLIISTRPKSASALVTRAVVELRRGDRVLMQRNY